jgi:uncharacterized membrane protein YkvA (DUF1232 family)
MVLYRLLNYIQTIISNTGGISMNFLTINKFLTTFMLNIELAWRLITDCRVAITNKLIFIIIAAIYLICPIDFIPDFLPVLGQSDDLLLFAFLMMQFINSCPVEIIEQHKNSILNGDWKIRIFKYLCDRK